jgi:hypothetical protein
LGVFDTPKRCYPLNNEWAKYIFGMILWLSEVTSWELSTDEGYQAIQDILEFTVGEGCMDCNDVETCLSTSAIIASLQSQITTNLNAIISNDTDIANNLAAIQGNTTNIANLTTRMDTAETDIVAIQGRLDTNETQIQNNLDSIIDHTALLIAHNTLLDNHEARLLALESAGGQGGVVARAYNKKSTQLVSDFLINDATNWMDTGLDIAVDIPNNAITQVSFRLTLIASSVINQHVAEFRIESDSEFTVVTEIHYEPEESGENHTWTIMGAFDGLPAGVTTFTLFARKILRNFSIPDNETLTIEVWSIGGQVAPVELGIVTFDTGGYPLYVLNSVPLNHSIEPNGNPGNCAEIANMVEDDFIEIEIDLQSEQTVNDIVMDMLHSVETSSTGYWIWADGDLKTLFSNSDHDTGSWHSMSFENDVPSVFPFTGQVIKIRVEATPSGISLLRLDNIDIQVS